VWDGGYCTLRYLVFRFQHWDRARWWPSTHGGHRSLFIINRSLSIWNSCDSNRRTGRNGTLPEGSRHDPTRTKPTSGHHPPHQDAVHVAGTTSPWVDWEILHFTSRRTWRPDSFLRVDGSGSGSGSGGLSTNLPFIEFYRSLSLKKHTVPHVKNIEKYRSRIWSIAKPCLPSLLFQSLLNSVSRSLLASFSRRQSQHKSKMGADSQKAMAQILGSDSCIRVLQTRIHHRLRNSGTLLDSQPRLLSATGRRPWKSCSLETLGTFSYTSVLVSNRALYEPLHNVVQ
jgi:hypothetical protein